MSVNNFSVCPHDTAKNQVGWFTLNTYLQRRLWVRMRFRPQDNVDEERAFVLATPHHVVYANPYSALCYAEQGYVPVARPVGVNDETLLVAKVGFALASAARPLKLASASDKIITHPLGLTLLPEVGLAPGDVEFDFCGNHMNAVKAVLAGTAQLAFVFNETWNGLSVSTRSGLQVRAETKAGSAFHCFMVGPEWADKIENVQQVLVGMKDDPSGRSILDELGFSALETVNGNQLEGLKSLIGH